MEKKLSDKELKKIERQIKNLYIETDGLENFEGTKLRWEIYDRYYNTFEHEHKDNEDVIRLMKEESRIRFGVVDRNVEIENQGLEDDWVGLPKPKDRRGTSIIEEMPIEESEFKQASREALQSILRFVDSEICETPDDFAEALTKFFDEMMERGEIPTIEKMGLALGHTNFGLAEMRNGDKGWEIASLINKAYQLIASYDVEMASQGKMNPTIYIFRSKNFYGLRDDYTHVVTGTDDKRTIETEEDIRARLLKNLPLVEDGE